VVAFRITVPGVLSEVNGVDCGSTIEDGAGARTLAGCAVKPIAFKKSCGFARLLKGDGLDKVRRVFVGAGFLFGVPLSISIVF
jgi:hypothetical protein